VFVLIYLQIRAYQVQYLKSKELLNGASLSNQLKEEEKKFENVSEKV